ncbi:MAG: LysR substrate-binding domain-containing protein [Pseudobdellovibrionaceae bacterium]
MNEDLFFANIDVQKSVVTVDNLIGVRSAVISGLGWSFVPKFLVHRDVLEGRLFQVPFDVPVSDRKLCIWWLRSRKSSKKQAAKLCSWLREVCSIS